MLNNRELVLREQRDTEETESTTIDVKLQNILSLFQNERQTVSQLQRELDSKKKSLYLIRDNIDKIEKEVTKHENLLYNIRLKLTGLNERDNAYKVQEENEKARQFETYSTINAEQGICDNLEKNMKDEKLQYAKELRKLNQELFQFYKDQLEK